MYNPEINTGWLRPFLFVLLSIVIAIAVAYLSQVILGYCPRTPAGIDALKNIFFWAGYACERQLGPSVIAAIPLFFLFIIIHAATNIGTLFQSKTPATAYSRVGLLAVLFFILYLLLFTIL
jgi:hypothetical protein